MGVTPDGSAAGIGTLWNGVDRLIDASPGLRDLQAHGLHLFAARRWRSLGLPVPPDLVRAELWAAFRLQTARRLLEQIRLACDGPILVIKGPAAACAYPEPELRPFVDLDLLVVDPEDVQAQLIAAGFKPVAVRSHPDTRHHLHPLQLPDHPLSVEVHKHPKWIEGLRVPSLDELLEGAELAPIGVEGILTLRPAHHAVVLCAHLLSHDPLARLLRLLDVAVTAEAADPAELDHLVAAWGMRKPWKLTVASAAALFRGARRPLPLRLWARNTYRAREATVIEMHLARCAAPFWIMPWSAALRAAERAIGGLLRPQPYETWRRKLTRTVRQLLQPTMRRTEHMRDVEVNLALPPEPESSRTVQSREP